MRRVIAGLMSGTSVDGIDAAVVEVRGAGERSRLKPITFVTTAYSRRVRERLLAIGVGSTQNLSTGLPEISSLNFELGKLFARAAGRAVNQAGLSLSEVDLIGSHGQTVYHSPNGNDPSTLQLGEPAVIAERTGVTTVADFRPADIAAGGSAFDALRPLPSFQAPEKISRDS